MLKPKYRLAWRERNRPTTARMVFKMTIRWKYSQNCRDFFVSDFYRAGKQKLETKHVQFEGAETYGR